MNKQPLKSKRIALTGTRKTEEMRTLIEKQGGIPLLRPLQETTLLGTKALLPDLSFILEKSIHWFIFTTGTGVKTMFQAAESMGAGEKYLNQLKQAKLAGRGHKVTRELKKRSLT